MSRENVELWRKWISAFNARDLEALIARSHPDIEFHSAFAAVGGGVYHGHNGQRRWHEDLQDAWGEEIHLDIEAYFDLGEHVLTFFVYRARGGQSGAEVAMPATGVARVRDGLTTYIKVYLSRADALHDLDVSEDELEPISP